MSAPGNLFVISAPSGTGKTSLVKTLVETLPNLTVSISHTTRPQRPAEIDGLNYYFISDIEFNDMIQRHEFLEHAVVFHYYYGTSQKWVEQTLAEGNDVILEIDWQGARQIQQLFPHCISIFILPPSLSDLENRLKKRNQDKADIITERLCDAEETVLHIHEFKYVVVNDDFEKAADELRVIIKASRLLEKKQTLKYAALLKDLRGKDTRINASDSNA